MGKKHKCPEFENHERWLVSYADMLTLLFAVFVVLFALKEGGEPQTRKTAGSMQESFSTPLEDIPIDRRAAPGEQGFGIFQYFQGNLKEPPLTKKHPGGTDTVEIVDGEMKTFQQALEQRLYGPQKFRKKQDPGTSRVVSVERTATGFKVRLLAQHFYASGSAEIRKEALGELKELAKLLKSLGRLIRIEGHTDSLPPRGGQSNWELSSMRAGRLAEYLIDQHSFPRSNISVAGYGDVRPMAHNGTEAGRRLNRRVEIHIRYSQEDE